MLRVRIKNFQVYSDVEVEVEGFTSITGPNNGGKSAIARAVRCAFQNIPAASFVRQGTTHSEVEVHFGGQDSFLWGRRAGTSGRPYYQIGSDQIFPGREVPDRVRGLGVRAVEIGGDLVWPQFGRQGESPFLLDRSGSVMAEAVCDPNRADQLNRMVKTMEGDRKVVRTRLSGVVERLGEDKRRLALLERVDPQPLMDRLDQIERSIISLYSTYGVYRELSSLWRGVQEKKTSLTSVAGCVVFDPTGLRESVGIYETLVRVRGRYRANLSRLESFAQVQAEQVSGLSVGGVREMYRRYQTLASLWGRFRAKRDQLEGFGRLSVQMESKDHLVRLKDRWGRLKDLQKTLGSSGKKIKDLVLLGESLQRDLDQVLEEKKNVLTQEGHCPFCGSDQI